MAPFSSEVINLPEIIQSCTEKWTNQVIAHVNNAVVRLGVIEGEYHWHQHQDDDEFFLVLEGMLWLDLEDRILALERFQGFNVPKGVMHRTRASQRTVILMVEKDSVKPQGD